MNDGAAAGLGAPVRATAHDLPDEIQGMIIRELLADLLAREAEGFDAIFESSRSLVESCHGRDRSLLPPIFHALAVDVMNRRIKSGAEQLGQIPLEQLSGEHLNAAIGEPMKQAWAAGVEPDTRDVAVLVESALAVQLGDTSAVTGSGIERSFSLIRASDSNGIKIRRTQLEEMVYALLNHHRDALAERLSGRTVSVQASGIDPEMLIQLAEQSNLSLRSFERASVQRAV
jgi:hypothetical protein